MSDWKPDKPEAGRAASPAARPAAPAARGASQGPAAAAPRASVVPGTRSSAPLDPSPVVRPLPGSTPPLRVGGGSRPAATSPSSGRRSPNPQVPPGHASSEGVTGKVTHDERGNAVWDWVKNTGRHAVESTSRLLRKLELPELKFEDAKDEELRIAPDATSGGYDPYNQATKPARPGPKK